MIAVRVEGLSRGPLNTLPKAKAGGPTFRSVFTALGTIVRGGPKKGREADNGGKKNLLRQDLLKDVSFEIERGSIVAFPGADMRAIEAMMRILTGSLQPSAGRIEVHGTIGGLISVGENLVADLTGHEVLRRERSYLLVPDERKDTFPDEVLEFAGLREFEDVLVRRYSTGMSLRLGLAMVLVAKPSVIVLGDIMGVGDLDFHQRCKERIRELAEEGVTFILGGPAFAVDDLADRILFLERGSITRDDSLASVGEEPDDESPSHNWHIANDRLSSSVLSLMGIRVMPRKKRGTFIRVDWRVKVGPQKLRPMLDFLHGNVVVFRSVSPREIEVEGPCWLRTTIALPQMLGSVPYRVRINCTSQIGQKTRTMKIAHALDAIPSGATWNHDEVAPLLRPRFDWEIETIPTEPAG